MSYSLLFAVIRSWNFYASPCTDQYCVSRIFQGIINTLLTTIAMEIPGLQRNVASSSYSFVRFFGGALAPLYRCDRRTYW
ncbi:hypothetical protein I8F73_03605 [Enterococcus faecalis]|nr:hypothetical protein [Enterococcus faecalis]